MFVDHDLPENVNSGVTVVFQTKLLHYNNKKYMSLWMRAWNMINWNAFPLKI